MDNHNEEIVTLVKIYDGRQPNVGEKRDGKIVPIRADLDKVAMEYPDERDDAKKYRLAQAFALLREKREHDQKI